MARMVGQRRAEAGVQRPPRGTPQPRRELTGPGPHPPGAPLPPCSLTNPPTHTLDPHSPAGETFRNPEQDPSVSSIYRLMYLYVCILLKQQRVHTRSTILSD